MYEVKIGSGFYLLKMSATLENIDRADDQLAEYLKEQTVEKELFAVRIILRESLLNAVTHGSQTDARRQVTMHVTINQDELVMKVCDQGEGFPWREMNREVQTLVEGGRGRALMRIYADRVEYNDKGNEVTLYKHINVALPAGR